MSNFNISKIKKDPDFVTRIANPTREEWIEAVKGNGMLCALVPPEMQDEELCEIAIQSNPQSITFVPPEKQTTRLCKVAISKDGMCIQYIDKKTPELVKLAIQQSPGALSFVDKKYWTQTILIEAVRKDPNILQIIPEDKQTEAVCLAAIEVDPKAICHISVKKQKPELVTRALKYGGSDIQGYLNFEEYVIESLRHKPSGRVYSVSNSSVVSPVKAKSTNYSAVPILPKHMPEYGKYEAYKSRRIGYKPDKSRNVTWTRKCANSGAPPSNITKTTTAKNTTKKVVKNKAKAKVNDGLVIENENMKGIYVNGKLKKETIYRQFNPNKNKIITFHDTRKDILRFVKGDSNIEESICRYIRVKYGETCLTKAKEFHGNSSTVEMIRNDPSFAKGAFYVKISDDRYEVFLKNTEYTSGWFGGKYANSTIEKIREYSFILSE